jgi:hypothetical protein
MPKYSPKRVDLPFLLPNTEKIMPKLEFLKKNLTRSMPTKMQNQKNEGFSY